MAEDDPEGFMKATVYDTDDLVRLYTLKLNRHLGVASSKQLKKGVGFQGSVSNGDQF